MQDLFTEEEQQKREQRAARFGLPAGSGLEWKPPQVGAVGRLVAAAAGWECGHACIVSACTNFGHAAMRNANKQRCWGLTPLQHSMNANSLKTENCWPHASEDEEKKQQQLETRSD